MNFVKIDPPGTFCTCEAFRDILKDRKGRTFIDVGCGTGVMSKVLLETGFTGYGVDFSERAVSVARASLRKYIDEGAYILHLGDVLTLPKEFAKVDVAISCMVMEHVEDDVEFIKKLTQFVRPGGAIVLAVPGRRDKWSIEDETVGHYRRYDRVDLENVMNQAGLTSVSARSVAVPVANILFHIGLWLLNRSSETNKLTQSKREQTEQSGIQEIKWKTTFPTPIKLILNRTTLYPLFVIQRLFYRTNLGVTMMGVGTC